ncbi:MAG: membrane associated rhomboid family serine protease [Bacillariaceae sp.]|jgi:membrane associated rhomboid family serine protease
MNNRSTDALRQLPAATLGVIVICVFLWIIQIALGWNIQLFTMCPRLILYMNEYYRIFTSVFNHANLTHIGMNMLSMSTISTVLEKRIGTLRLLFSIWWSILLTSTIYIIIAYTAYKIFGYDTWMYQHSIGFSGIIFHLSVLESYLNPGKRSIFGFFSVPSFVYPWALLLILQLILPGLSFLGHLSGILTGTLEYYGVWDRLFLSDSFLIEIESLPIMRRLVSLDNFVPTSISTQQALRSSSSSSSADSSSSSSSSSSFFQSIHKILNIIFKFFRDVLETILVCICGRNYRLNSNVFRRFWERLTLRRHSNNNNNDNNNNITECGGIIRPPEFYEGDDLLDEEENIVSQEREPILSRII